MIPFPVNEPELWPAYVPDGVTQYIRLFSEWGGTKLERLRAAGYEVVVLDEGAEKGVSGADVRDALREGGDWESLVTAGGRARDPLARARPAPPRCTRSSSSSSTGSATARTTSLGGRTGNEAARTPNLDRLCARGSSGVLYAVGPAGLRRARSRTGRSSATGPRSFPAARCSRRSGRGQDVSAEHVFAYAALQAGGASRDG